MTDARAALHATPEHLVRRIHLINGGWHGLRDLWPEAEGQDPVLRGMRELKLVLQLQLLRHDPAVATLTLDDRPELPEPCFSVRLLRPIAGFRDACHLPVRVAKLALTEAEQARWLEAAP